MSNTIISSRKSAIPFYAHVRVPDIPKKAPKVTEANFFIPKVDEYSLIVTKNYKVAQLKKICKFHNLKVSGKKSQLINQIYNYLFLSKYAIVIQKFMKGKLVRKWCSTHGPAYINRSLCTNQTDFFTMNELKNTPINQFFSFKDEDGFIYGFNIISLYTLHQKAAENNEEALNPYNRNKLPKSLIKDFRDMIRISRVLKYDIEINIKEDNCISDAKKLELRILSLFQEIDQLGNYSDQNWFTSLTREQIVLYLRELYDIWNYRAQLSNETKRNIAPPIGDPFRTINMNYLNEIPFDNIKKLAVSIMEILVKKGVNNDSRSLGAFYVLAGLTLVNINAATAMPWLYQSVAHV